MFTSSPHEAFDDRSVFHVDSTEINIEGDYETML